MYYEEMFDGGKWWNRLSPDSEWSEMTYSQVAARLQTLKDELGKAAAEDSNKIYLIRLVRAKLKEAIDYLERF